MFEKTMKRFILEGDLYFPIKGIAYYYEDLNRPERPILPEGQELFIQESSKRGQYLHEYIATGQCPNQQDLQKFINQLNKEEVVGVLQGVVSHEQYLKYRLKFPAGKLPATDIGVCGKYDALTRDSVLEFKFSERLKNVKYFSSFALQLAGYALAPELNLSKGILINGSASDIAIYQIDLTVPKELFKKVVYCVTHDLVDKQLAKEINKLYRLFIKVN